MKRIKSLSIVTILLSIISLSAQSDGSLAARADSLHKKIFSIDTHNDTAICTNHPNNDYGVQKGQVTFPLMKKGGLDAAFFAIYLEQGLRDQESLKKATQYAIDEIRLFKEHINKNRDEAGIAWCADDFWKLKKEGKSIVMFAIENGYALGTDIKNVEMFYDMGVRAITLSHNYNNDICDSSRDSVVEWHGLSPFGYEVVKEMNRLGIIVDISHTSSETLFDCIETSKAPIMATHSGVWNIKNHPRNLTDREMKAIAKKGGLIQVATGRFFLSFLPKSEVNISHLCNHIEYVKNLVGVEHVGIGTDFDGGGGVVGLEDVSKMKNITIELMRRGWSDDELKLFWGENVIRMMKEVEEISRELSSDNECISCK